MHQQLDFFGCDEGCSASDDFGRTQVDRITGDQDFALVVERPSHLHRSHLLLY